jgi:transcriptional regulator with XRE-family HTH domain
MSKTPTPVGRSKSVPNNNNNNHEPNGSLAHKDVIKREFGQRLRRAMINKGMTQTDLAHAAAKHTPSKTFGRDLVSSYISGRYIPNPINLAALAKALGIDPEELLPQSNNLPRRGESTPPLDIRVLGDDRASLRVNQVVSLDVALKVAQLINDDTKKG